MDERKLPQESLDPVLRSAFVRDFLDLAGTASLKGWHERNGGNLSYRLKEEEVRQVSGALSSKGEWTSLGLSALDLAGETFLVTGSGKYFQFMESDPKVNFGLIELDQTGEMYRIVWGLQGAKPTSELPTHLMNHNLVKIRSNGLHRVIYHAHPPNLIALTFVLSLTDQAFTKELWGMATECPVIFPEGVGVVPWMVPGGPEIALATAELIKKYNVVVWAHHGVFCSGEGFRETFGLMDTVEKSAEVSVKVRSMGGARRGIEREQFLDLARSFQVNLSEEFL
ncbi:MAG: rhamnulose-1-phosphate aldolase [Deltaproteobacteria bacterium]|nr:rhamnulose-1-phosphate aldolase [Deltaproteobacteria bacterium]